MTTSILLHLYSRLPNFFRVQKIDYVRGVSQGNAAQGGAARRLRVSLVRQSRPSGARSWS